MVNTTIADFYERDLNKLIEEISLFKNEEDIWKKYGSIKNSAGNLVLHLVGNLNHFIGATLATTGYERNREIEFAAMGVARSELISQVKSAIPMVTETIAALTAEHMAADFPIPINNVTSSTSTTLLHLLLHLNYHLGQINYLRRMQE